MTERVKPRLSGGELMKRGVSPGVSPVEANPLPMSSVGFLPNSKKGIPYSGKFSNGANFRIFRMRSSLCEN